MTREETIKIISLYTLAGVKFEGDKNEIISLWHECLKDIEFKFVVTGAKEVLKNDTELFANGLIAKTRQKAKLFRELYLINQANKQIEGKNDIRRLGNSSK